MANKHMKNMLTIPGHKGNEVKITQRFHLTPVTIVTIKNNINNKCWKKGNLVKPLWETTWRFH
jgi:hypothetical protein